jgi:multiple sugar transport system ATP-binding protein
MSVYKNLAFGLETARLPRPEIDERVKRAAEILRIEPLLQRKPKQLSGGQRQRVAIGRAIVREPRIFLFDEPLSNLDAELRVQMRVEIAKLHHDLGNTMIYVTHDQVEAMTMADKIVVLRAGRIEQAGSPLDLYNRPANRFVAGFIGSPRMNFVPCTVAAVTPEGLQLRDAAGRGYLAAVNAGDLRPGAEVELGLRPEHLEVGSAGHPVAVQGIEQLGGECYLYCRTDDGLALTAHLPGQTAIRRGDRAHVGFPPELAHVFRADDGRALLRRVVGEAVAEPE